MIEPLIVALKDATVRVWQEMFGTQALPGVSRLDELAMVHPWEISGMLAITSQGRGVVALRLTRRLVDRILQRSGMECATEEEREPTVNALVAELTNIVCGNGISTVHEWSLDISVPLVVQGENHRISWPRIGPIHVLPFATPDGDFELHVSFAPEVAK